MIDLIGKKRIMVNGVRMWTAVAREAYSGDFLVAWRGRFGGDATVYQATGETRKEFYARAARELRYSR